MLLMPRENLFVAMGLFCTWLSIIKTPTPVFLEPGMGFLLFHFVARENGRQFCDATTDFPRNDVWEKKRAQNSILMTCHYPDLGSASDWLKQISHAELTNQKHYSDLAIDTSSVWFFCLRFSNVISRGNQW